MIPLRKPRDRGSFYLWIAVAMNCTVLVGFWFTYFGPIFSGTYPQVSPIVHVHGWTFFAWYFLLILQAGLIRSHKLLIHRTIGLASIGLGVVMIIVGLITSAVRVSQSVGPDGDPFWRLMGLPIFSIWLLFTTFYVAAIYYRWRVPVHKRFMLLASAAALSAAAFRIFVQGFGFKQWVAIAGTLSPNLFIIVAMFNDYQSIGKIHRVYQWGLLISMGLVGGAFALAILHEGSIIEQGVAKIGRILTPLY